MFSFSTVQLLFSELSKLVPAIEAIMASGEAKTVEDAIGALINHATPGKPNSPTLSGPAPQKTT